MATSEMPEGTPIPPIVISEAESPRLRGSYHVQKDNDGYFVQIDGAYFPVKVTWDGQRASAAIDKEAWATFDRPTAIEQSESEKPDIAVELRRIADALETIAKVAKQEFSEKIEIRHEDEGHNKP